MRSNCQSPEITEIWGKPEHMIVNFCINRSIPEAQSHPHGFSGICPLCPAQALF